MSDLCELVITAPDPDWLLDLTRQLVKEGLCASVHHFSPVRTIYLWHGELVERTEGRVERVKAEHPYEVPGISARPIIDRNRDYLRWIEDETGGTHDHLHGRRS